MFGYTIVKKDYIAELEIDNRIQYRTNIRKDKSIKHHRKALRDLANQAEHAANSSTKLKKSDLVDILKNIKDVAEDRLGVREVL